MRLMEARYAAEGWTRVGRKHTSMTTRKTMSRYNIIWRRVRRAARMLGVGGRGGT
jgi:hypothetical protein